MHGHLPSLDELKAQARRLRTTLGEAGQSVGHSKSLELIARQYGYNDWNTLHAAVGNAPRPGVAVGDKVRGRYLGQSFTGTVLGLEVLTSRPGYMKITIHFDEPVDVVTFESFSAFRTRVSVTIDETGTSPDRTSNGRPHLELSS